MYQKTGEESDDILCVDSVADAFPNISKDASEVSQQGSMRLGLS